MQHHDHDLTLIAAHAAGDLSDHERTRAQAVLDACRPCAELQNDLVALAAATRALPNLATVPRDFRLSADQAARLRRGRWLRSVLAPFGAAQSAARPMAAAFTSLGLAGLLVATVLPGLFGSAASMGIERDQTGAGGPLAGATTAPEQPIGAAGQPTTAPAPNGPGAGVDSVATAAPGNGEFGSKGGTSGTAPSSPPAGAVDGDPSDGAGRTSATGPANLLLAGSLALLAIGLALFGLRVAGRRLRL